MPTNATPQSPGLPDLLSHQGACVITLTMNRPQARTTLSRPMLHAMGRLQTKDEFRPAERGIVLTGSGNAFCADGDVKHMGAAGAAPLTVDDAIHLQRHSQRETTGHLFRMLKHPLAALPRAFVEKRSPVFHGR